MKNALLPGFGGPMGRYARKHGRWFNPLPWAILLATVLFSALALRQLPCIQTDPTQAVNAFIRLCYSDIPLTYTGRGFAFGDLPFGDQELQVSPLLGLFMLVCIWLATLAGAKVGTADVMGSSVTAVKLQLAGAEIFFAITAVLLFVCFLIWVVSMVLVGRDSQGGKYRSWDGVLLAASPVVLAVGLISWDLFPIALSAVGVWQFAKSKLLESGIWFGLAVAAGTMPIAVVLAVGAAILLRGKISQLVTFGVSVLAVWLVVHLPLLLRDWTAVVGYYRAQVSAELGYGSIWYLLQTTGWQPRAVGSIGFVILMLLLGITVAWLYLKKLQPRVGTLIAIFVFATVMLGASYPPQAGLWLLFALLLARPFKPELLAFSIVQLGYYFAIWGWLSGHLTSAKSGPDKLYFLAILLHFGVDLWLLINYYRDLRRPASTVEQDPISGVLASQPTQPLELAQDDLLPSQLSK